MNNYKVTPDDLRRFEEDGYWISPKLLSDEEIAKLRHVHERMEQGNHHDSDGYPMTAFQVPDNPVALRQLNNGWWIYDDVYAIVTDAHLGEIVADLLGINSVRLWHDQVINKPGMNILTQSGEAEVSGSGNVGWHQDYAYWKCCHTNQMVTAWIALQDTDLSNGAMTTILGSHKWGLIEGSDTFFDTNMEALREKFRLDGKEWVEEPCIMKAGQISFHHSLTFHGSGPNYSADPRLSVIAHLMPGDTRFQANVQQHGNVQYIGPRVKDGDLFDSAYFPLLYSREPK